MQDRRVWRSLTSTVAAVALAVTAAPGTAAATALPTWPENPNWQSLVPAPTSSAP
jgi:hypothetical protein